MRSLLGGWGPPDVPGCGSRRRESPARGASAFSSSSLGSTAAAAERLWVASTPHSRWKRATFCGSCSHPTSWARRCLSDMVTGLAQPADRGTAAGGRAAPGAAPNGPRAPGQRQRRLAPPVRFWRVTAPQAGAAAARLRPARPSLAARAPPPRAASARRRAPRPTHDCPSGRCRARWVRPELSGGAWVLRLGGWLPRGSPPYPPGVAALGKRDVARPPSPAPALVPRWLL